MFAGAGDADDGDFPTTAAELQANFETVRELGLSDAVEATLVRVLATGKSSSR